MKIKHLQTYLIGLCFTMLLGTHCSGTDCTVPKQYVNQIAQIENLGRQLVSLKDSLALEGENVFVWNKSAEKYLVKIDSSNNRYRHLAKQLDDLGIRMFSFQSGGVAMYYHQNSDFSKGEMILKYFLYADSSVNTTLDNKELGDAAWEYTCNTLLTSQLRHIVYREVN